jgi:hypothetical protein
MVYGGAGVWLLAVLSFVISGNASRSSGVKTRPPAQPQQQPARCDAC